MASSQAIQHDSENSNSRSVKIAFDNTYARLPERFYSRIHPTPVAEPGLIKLNLQLAEELGLDAEALASPEGVAVLAGNRVAEGSEPLAQAYAGHQFGHFVPQLGDGRANLLGEIIARNGNRYDLQLKGSGRTPFSRNGDGRAAVGPVLREYLVSEAMAALGIPTTRSLAAVTTGETVLRETELPGAVLTRVAASHLRVGTFEYFAARQDWEAIQVLADYAIARHYPEAAQVERRYFAFLDGVISRHAKLVAQWMHVGFIHGVMNTDNTSISGETIDFGPCAFMESYDQATVFSSIDRMGRYAYANQAPIAHWNLTRLAETLLPLLEQEAGAPEAGVELAKESLGRFAAQFEAAFVEGWRRKLGLMTTQPSDIELIEDLLERLTKNQCDFTLTFRLLSEAAGDKEADDKVRALFFDPRSYDDWAVKWRARLEQESTVAASDRVQSMKRANPLFIPRNHLVEEAIEAAAEQKDFQPFEQLLEIVLHPYEDRPGFERYTLPARPEQRVLQTFCGT